MRLVAEHPVGDVDSVLLEETSQLHVLILVESRTQLHDAGDLLAAAGCAYERIDERRVYVCPVETLLDGEDIGVLGGRRRNFSTLASKDS